MPMAKSSNRGFAAMDPEKQREIARKGGKAAHQKGTAHEFSSDEARAAGRKGGQAVSKDRQHMASIGRQGGEAVSRDRDHMARIGREGGEARASAASQRSKKTKAVASDERTTPANDGEEEERKDVAEE